MIGITCAEGAGDEELPIAGGDVELPVVVAKGGAAAEPVETEEADAANGVVDAAGEDDAAAVAEVGAEVEPAMAEDADGTFGGDAMMRIRMRGGAEP